MSISILLVDDDANLTFAFSERLKRRGFTTTVLSNPREVMEDLEKNKYDLVLMDLIMPELDGLSLLTQIRTKYDKDVLPVIILTVIDDSANLIELFKHGANDYLTKPANVDIAAARISAHVSAAKLQREVTERKQMEAVTAMVVTYNHQINNPLAIAVTSLDLLRNTENINLDRVESLQNALNRISNIVQTIAKICKENSITFESYLGDVKMIKLK